MFKVRPACAPTKANEQLGGVPTLYYFDLKSMGLGEVLRLFFEDADVSFNDSRVIDFAKFKEENLKGPQGWNPALSMPIVELNGEYFTQSYSILRFFSRKLGGKYDGKTSEDIYFVDLIADIISDFRALFVRARYGPNPEQDMPKHIATEAPRYINALETHLARRGPGPFVLGENVTYADFLIFQIAHDEGFEVLKETPALTRLVEAVKTRPNVAKYIQSDRYFG